MLDLISLSSSTFISNMAFRSSTISHSFSVKRHHLSRNQESAKPFILVNESYIMTQTTSDSSGSFSIRAFSVLVFLSPSTPAQQLSLLAFRPSFLSIRMVFISLRRCRSPG
ncbi:hypothetical protein ATANTOWER_026698 [Ataeniobius toweri]|uniref:Uncharacterized protein n=1 Tax=Ataeniobius toweri TaxID=208326 RepID=A0ABU7A9P4_9TELE|nr:hypothetical protein [Ataeniobius toweri]